MSIDRDEILEKLAFHRSELKKQRAEVNRYESLLKDCKNSYKNHQDKIARQTYLISVDFDSIDEYLKIYQDAAIGDIVAWLNNRRDLPTDARHFNLDNFRKYFITRMKDSHKYIITRGSGKQYVINLAA